MANSQLKQWADSLFAQAKAIGDTARATASVAQGGKGFGSGIIRSDDQAVLNELADKIVDAALKAGAVQDDINRVCIQIHAIADKYP
jgi:hypothetical protein